MADGWEGQRRHCCPTSEALHSSKKRSSNSSRTLPDPADQAIGVTATGRVRRPPVPFHPPALHRPTLAQKDNPPPPPPPPPPLLTDWHKQIIDIWPVTCQTQRPATGPSADFAARCQSIIFTFHILVMEPSHVTLSIDDSLAVELYRNQ